MSTWAQEEATLPRIQAEMAALLAETLHWQGPVAEIGVLPQLLAQTTAARVVAERKTMGLMQFMAAQVVEVMAAEFVELRPMVELAAPKTAEVAAVMPTPVQLALRRRLAATDRPERQPIAGQEQAAEPALALQEAVELSLRLKVSC
jgi:hypothetical protein